MVLPRRHGAVESGTLLLNRVVHHSVILDLMALDSYRVEEAQQRRPPASPPPGPGADAGVLLPLPADYDTRRTTDDA